MSETTYREKAASIDREKLSGSKSESRVVLKAKGPLERSTARRETVMPGSAATNPAERDRQASGAQPGIHGTRSRPRKLYDQKAESIAKTAASGKKAESVKRGKKLSDNAKLALAAAILIAVGSGLYVSVPLVTIVKTVTVNGMANVTQPEILASLDLTAETNLVNADLPGMEARIIANPKVASASLRRVFPDTIVVDLVERKPVACVLVNDESGTRSVAIDGAGVAFSYLDRIDSSGRLPVLSGIRFEHFVPGQKLPDYLVPLLGDIAALSRDAPETLAAFSEIKVEKIAESEAELLLFPSGRTVPIRMPARLSKASLGSALLVLDILAGRSDASSIEEIDFRTGTIVYRTKEAQAG